MWRWLFMTVVALMTDVAILAQSTQIDGARQVRNIDFGNAAATRPVKSGTNVPANCAVGELFYKTDAIAGANLYGCTASDSWTVLSGGPATFVPGNSTIVAVTDQGTGAQLLSVNPAAVAVLSENNDFTGANKLSALNLSTWVVNDATAGTAFARLAMLTGDGTARVAGVGNQGRLLGVVISGDGTSGSARIAVQGTAVCEFDGPTTAGHYVQLSMSEDGKCTDAGSDRPASGQILGFVTSTNGGPGAYSVLLASSVAGVANSTAGEQMNWVGTCDGAGVFYRNAWNRDATGVGDAACLLDGFTEATSPYASFAWQPTDNGYVYTRFLLPATWLPSQPTSLRLLLSESNAGDGLNLGWSVQTACVGSNWGRSWGGAVPIAFNAAQSGSIVSVADTQKHTADAAPLTVSGCNPGDVLVVRFRRDNSVAGNSAAWLLLVGARISYMRSL